MNRISRTFLILIISSLSSCKSYSSTYSSSSVNKDSLSSNTSTKQDNFQSIKEFILNNSVSGNDIVGYKLPINDNSFCLTKRYEDVIYLGYELTNYGLEEFIQISLILIDNNLKAEGKYSLSSYSKIELSFEFDVLNTFSIGTSFKEFDVFDLAGSNQEMYLSNSLKDLPMKINNIFIGFNEYLLNCFCNIQLHDLGFINY